MVIIEGPDGSGKSTLVRQLHEQLKPAWQWHSAGPCKTKKDITNKMNEVLHTFGGTRSLIDRVPCIGEKVYGPLLRGVDLLEGTSYLGNLIQAGVPIIYCRPPIHCMLPDEHETRPEEDPAHIAAVAKHQVSLIQTYDLVMKDIPHFKYDYDCIGRDEMIKLLVAYIKLYWEKIDA